MADDEFQWRQSLALVSVVIFMVFVGLPLWWKTTEVYRSSLPYSEIKELQKAASSISVEVDIVSLLPDDSNLQLEFKKLSDFSRNVELAGSRVDIRCRILRKTLDDPVKAELLQNLRNNRNADLSQYHSLSTSIGHFNLFIVGDGLLSANSSSPQSIFYSSQRHVIVERSTSEKDVSDVLSNLCGTKRFQDLFTKALVAGDTNHYQKLRRIKVSPGYQITLTMINPDPISMDTQWTIEQATEAVLLPFLQQEGIALLGNYTISSQVLYYTDVHFKTSYSKKHTSYIIRSTELPSMISNVEAKLGSHVSQWPSLNFIVYVPKHSEHPLYIRGSGRDIVDAFLVPQWGGVVLYNYHSNTSQSVKVVMEDVMLTVVKQLKLLFGLLEDKDTQCDSDNPECVSKWVMDHILISRAIESVSMASSSLYSLTSLLDNVKNMVISDHIQEEVVSTLGQIHRFHELSRNSDWHLAFKAAELALKHSETAFFDPSILALLYFPDDQKYAIYIPLFLPISVPVVIAVVTAVKRWKKKRASQS